MFVAEPPNPREAVRWLCQSAVAGHVRAQYQLALCLHHGCGVDNDIQEAVWSSVVIIIIIFQSSVLFSELTFFELAMQLLLVDTGEFTEPVNCPCRYSLIKLLGWQN